jgi:predicted small lipoprotein YifL
VSAPSRLATASAAVVAAILTLTGCSGSGPTAAPTSATTASPSVSTFPTLPESVLPVIPGVSYAESSSAEQALARTHVGTTLSAFSGGISRDLVADGRTVGGLQVYRFAGDVPLADYGRFPPMMVYTYAGAAPTQQQIGGKSVQVVGSAPQSGHAVLAWTVKDRVLILWADDLATAKLYAARSILSGI